MIPVLTALQAGCVQQPTIGTLIGLQGSVFSTTPVNITFPGYNQTVPTSKATHKGGLTQAAIIGIATALGVLFILAIAILIICSRKRKNLDRLRKLRLNSPLDPRFGAENITAPTKGSYGTPFAKAPLTAYEHFVPSQYKAREYAELDSTQDVSDKYDFSSRDRNQPSAGHYSHPRTSHFTDQTETALPTHQAYIPATYSPASPTGSEATSDTYQLKEVPSRFSPKHVPPPIMVIPKPPTHKKSSSVQSETQVPQRLETNLSLFPTSSQPKAELQHQRQARPRVDTGNLSYSRPRGENRSRDGSRTRIENRSREGSKDRGGSRADSRNRAEARSENRPREDSRSRGVEESSRVTTQALHSQRMTEEQLPSRSASRADSYKRYTARPGISNTNASKDEPLQKHDARLEFEMAERQRTEKERMEGLATITKDSFKKKKKKKSKSRPEEVSPIDAESDGEEQWPGSY